MKIPAKFAFNFLAVSEKNIIKNILQITLSCHATASIRILCNILRKKKMFPICTEGIQIYM
jgi:hypothetical protein